MYKCIAFDVDGTMIDTEAAIFKALGDVLYEELGKRVSEAEMAKTLGMMGEQTLGLFGVQDVPGAIARWYRYLAENRSLNRLYPGIEKTLEVIGHTGCTLAVLTNRKRFEVVEDPLFHPLAHMFQWLQCGDDTANNKPHPEPLFELMRKTGLGAHEILFIGDTIHDHGCATAAGVDFMLAGWGARNPEAIGAEKILEHPYELVEHLFVHCREDQIHEAG